MRSTNETESTTCDPPNPRLITFNSGKSCPSVFQSRMLELPMNSTAFFGGGFVLSCASKAAISFSHRLVVCAKAPAANNARTIALLSMCIPDSRQHLIANQALLVSPLSRQKPDAIVNDDLGCELRCPLPALFS